MQRDLRRKNAIKTVDPELTKPNQQDDGSAKK
jgi:hypothetical protein